MKNLALKVVFAEWVGVLGGSIVGLKLLLTVKLGKGSRLLAKIALNSGGKGFPEPDAGELFVEVVFNDESEDGELFGFNGVIFRKLYLK